MSISPINLLLVEDSEGDILLIQLALEEAKIVNTLHVCKDGAAAIHYLEDLALNDSDALPDLILLDINLPKKNGHEVLAIVKSNDLLESIPLIVLTTSSSEFDIFKAYGLHANCYITKPIEFNEFITLIKKIENFWSSTFKLPKKKVNSER